MEEPNLIQAGKTSGKPEKTTKQIIQLATWQNRLLPWLVIMPTILILLFIYLATSQMQRFNAVIDAKEESVIEKLIPTKADSALNAKLKGDLDYIRWITLARLEEKSLDRRYSQGGLLLVSRIFTKYLGFFTGMILAIVGAVFIIGKLQESSSDIEGAIGEQMKLKIVSSSPGIIFGVLGTVLMLSTILQHAEISVKDQPLFLNPANVLLNSGQTLDADSAAEPKKHQIDLKDIEGLEADDTH
ncbi:MAG: hypothetical protein K0M50_13935 [Prolixibacteraceae bacterium]|nr:hypothetical protein [Prolixibacteraceae bacterium]